MVIKKDEMDAGDKKNNAGEQVHESLHNRVGLRDGSWAAGFAKTRRRFWL